MTKKQSDIEEKAFKIFGVFLIIFSIFSLILGFTGDNVYEEGTISIKGSRSRTLGLEFRQDQAVLLSYEITEGPDEIHLVVETDMMMGGTVIDLEETGNNKYKFEVDKTDIYYISFINTGSENITLDYEIGIEGRTNNPVCVIVFIITLIMGLVILFVSYKDEIFRF